MTDREPVLDPDKDPLAALHAAVDQFILAAYQDLGHALQVSLERHMAPGQPLTDRQARAIMADYDRASARIFGSKRGDQESDLYTLVAAAAHGAQAIPYAANAQRWRQAMDPDLWAAVLAEAEE